MYTKAYVDYTKLPTTYEQQVDILKNRGMDFEGFTQEQLKIIFQRIGYYHLTPYWLNFKDDNDKFRPGTKFKHVLNLYYFDRELRSLVLEGVESFEVNFRTVFANHLSCTYQTPFPHLKKQIFRNVDQHARTLAKLITEYSTSKEKFAEHFKNKYSENIPPIWVSTEFMTLGELCKWFTNLSSEEDKKAIAGYFHLSPSLFESFISSLARIRNFAAHQSRLWNRIMINKISKPYNNQELCANFDMKAYEIDSKESRKIYNTLIVLIYCLKKTGSQLNLAQLLKQKIEKFNIDPLSMGFPSNWRNLSLWQ